MNMPVAPESITAQWSRYLLQFDNDNAVARERRIGRGGWMSVKVTWNEWLRRFQQGMSTVDDDDDGVFRRRDDDDDDDDGAVDNVDTVDSVDAVAIDRVLGLPPVETVGDDGACGGGRSVRIFRRRRRGGTMCHVSMTASSIIVYVCGLLFSLHERAI